jgi:hypothetical protein
MLKAAHPDIAPYLDRALTWRQQVLNSLGVQYSFVGAIAVALVANAAVAYALATYALSQGQEQKARAALAEVRASLLSAWTVVYRESGKAHASPAAAIDALMADFESDSTADSTASGTNVALATPAPPDGTNVASHATTEPPTTGDNVG